VKRSEARHDEVADVIDLRASRSRSLPYAEATAPNAVLSDFYEADYPQIVAAIAMVGTDIETACDAVDEAVADAWEGGIARSGQALFASSVRARALANARKGSRRKVLERRAGKRMRAELVVDRDAIDGALTLDVQRVLQTISTRQREVVVLHYMFDMTVEDVALELGISQSTVKTTLKRARYLLARRLSDDAEPEPDFYQDES
jgi:RNA polymerase sigma-70 factor (ECF subfamily)